MYRLGLLKAFKMIPTRGVVGLEIRALKNILEANQEELMKLRELYQVYHAASILPIG